MPLIEETASSPTSLPIDASSSESSSDVKKYQPTSTDFRHYYEHYLPFKSIFTWLNHSHVPQNDFTMREFAFEFKSGAYQRYNSFENASEFKATVLKSQPTRFEIGAITMILEHVVQRLPFAQNVGNLLISPSKLLM
ncbi:unnamed protein product [[Candida] boidinii]|nr:unnamed protein product [[Candida] boidinii]